jgi:hypothetical protein
VNLSFELTFPGFNLPAGRIQTCFLVSNMVIRSRASTSNRLTACPDDVFWFLLLIVSFQCLIDIFLPMDNILHNRSCPTSSWLMSYCPIDSCPTSSWLTSSCPIDSSRCLIAAKLPSPSPSPPRLAQRSPFQLLLT